MVKSLNVPVYNLSAILLFIDAIAMPSSLRITLISEKMIFNTPEIFQGLLAMYL